MIENSKLSHYKIKKIIQCFCVDIPASKTALLLNLNRNTINYWYMLFRETIYDHQTDLRAKFVGSIEVDESYFGAKRQRVSWKVKAWSWDSKTASIWNIRT
jgi:hypothetical protein